MSSILEVEGLCKRFARREVLHDVFFSVSAGTITVLLGPNGAGKTTLLRVVLGLLRPHAGSVAVCGRLLHGARAARATGRAVRALVGFVPDAPDAHGWMSPRELFRFMGPQYPTWDEGVARSATERLGVPLDTRFARLSKGEGTKAMLAAALATRAPLLLLDEPFSGLDPKAREELLRSLLAEIELEECALLVSTHDMEVAARLADRVVMLRAGLVQAEGTLAEVLGSGTEPARASAGLKQLFEDPATRKASA